MAEPNWEAPNSLLSSETKSAELDVTTAKNKEIFDDLLTELNMGGGGEEDWMKTEPEKKKVDEGPKLDNFFRMGWYMAIVCAFMEMLLLVVVSDMLFMSYAGHVPKVKKCGSFNMSERQDAKQRCEVLEKLLKKNHSMEVYGCTSNAITEKDLDFHFRSINVDFKLHCQTSQVKKYTSIQMVGIIPGVIVAGWTSDAFGRRLTMLCALPAWMLCMVATSFVPNLLWFTVVRFFVCFFNGALAVTLIVYSTEMYPPNMRFCLMNIITWAPNYILFAGIAFLSHDWRLLQRVLACCILPSIGLLWFLDESPRFLIRVGKIEAAKRVILRMHKINRRECDEKLLDEVLERESAESKKTITKKYNYLHLFHSCKFAKYTLSVSFSLLVVTLITYSINLNMPGGLSDSPYNSMILLGVCKYVVSLLVAFGDLKFTWINRKRTHLVSELLVLACLGLYIIMHIFAVNVWWVSRGCLIGAVAFCAGLFNAIKLSGNELYPTGVRNLSCSANQVSSRVGIALALLLYLLDNTCEVRICGVISFVLLFLLTLFDTWFFQLVIRETKGEPLLTDFPPRSEY